MSIVDTSDHTLPTVITEEHRKQIQGALKEMSNSMTRIEAEKDHMKAIAEKILEDTLVPKKDFAKLAKIYHASNLAQEAAKSEEFMQFAEAVLEPLRLN
jgi:hypothetical protein|tara:strand:+ start:2905 stop:3201 length:297 start_codon:yes stop_codon:yes gene_type:complete